MDVMEALWQQVSDKLYIARERFVEGLVGWKLDPQYNEAGELAVVWMTRGPDLHFTTFGARWALSRSDIRARLLPLIEAFGYAKTDTPIEDVRQQRFNRLLGFVETGRDAFHIHYRIERLRHA